MSNMKSFKQFIAEAKQVGSIYHYSNPNSIESILRSNSMSGDDIHAGHVSFTRNKNFHKTKREGVPVHASLEFDGDKLSERHKITPYRDKDFLGSKYKDTRTKAGTYDESEERIQGPLKNIRRHVKAIRIHDKNIHPSEHERLKFSSKYYGIPLKYE